MSNSKKVSLSIQEAQVERPVCLLAEFESVAGIIRATKAIKQVGFRHFDVYTPFPIHEISGLERMRVTIFRWFIFLSGLSGATVALLLQWYTNAFNYPFLVSGKPYFSLPANIPITFELTILFSALGTFLGILFFGGLPRFAHPVYRSNVFKRVTNDRFFISIDATEPAFDPIKTKDALLSLGASTVDEIYGFPPSTYLLPKGLPYTLLILVAIAIVPLANIALIRSKSSPVPRLSIIPDMDKQQKLKAQAESTLFIDGRAMRLPVAGTIARGELREDDHFYRGKINGDWATTFPLTISEEFIKRGQNRFEIYCATCHGLDGYGHGSTAKRAEELEQATWVPPSNLHDATVRARQVGHIFNTITNGIRNMPAYGSQIPVLDRWAIVAYVRALQRSQRAKLEDVSLEMRKELEARRKG